MGNLWFYDEVETFVLLDKGVHLASYIEVSYDQSFAAASQKGLIDKSDVKSVPLVSASIPLGYHSTQRQKWPSLKKVEIRRKKKEQKDQGQFLIDTNSPDWSKLDRWILVYYFGLNVCYVILIWSFVIQLLKF